MLQINILKDLIRGLGEKISSLSIDVNRMEERLNEFAKSMHELKEQSKKK